MYGAECIAMILAGGQGSRLGALTRNIAKPAVSFGGKYRIIDFTLSNCTHSGISTVGVLTQYRPFELNTYIGNGSPWDLDRSRGGVHILPPYQKSGEGEWYCGTANAVYQNIGFIERFSPGYVLILSGDHIYKMHYGKMLEFHKGTGTVGTIGVLRVPVAEASRFGIMETDTSSRITAFWEKPKEPKGNLASMGVYIFEWQVLREYLMLDALDPASQNDFGKNIIPRMLSAGEKLSAYTFDGYWRDVGTPESLWEANMDLLAMPPRFDLYDADWPILRRAENLPPHFVGANARVLDSILAEGCRMYGTAEKSVLSMDTTVLEGATVSHSVLLPGAVVGQGARVENAILGRGARVSRSAQIRPQKDGEIAVVESETP